MEIPNPDSNYPKPFEQGGATDGMFAAAEPMWFSEPTVPTSADPEARAKDLVALFLSAGYYRCHDSARCGDESVTMKNQLDQLLDNAPASFEGAVLRYAQRGVYHYMCSRNNNFTNRSQKGQLTVK